MTSYFDCWLRVATTLFAQALAGEPQLAESLPRPLSAGSFGWAATLEGDLAGRFSVVLDSSVLEAPLLGEGADQRAGWGELLRETFDAAAGDMLAAGGVRCRIAHAEEIVAENKVTHSFQLRSGEQTWTVLVLDKVQPAEKLPAAEAVDRTPAVAPSLAPLAPTDGSLLVSPGIELLLDVELDASLRFGSCEMVLADILELGPGDVVELDRHVADPVDLIVGDKIVARGEVVLVNGNFGLKVREVAAPRKRLESIRCLF